MLPYSRSQYFLVDLAQILTPDSKLHRVYVISFESLCSCWPVLTFFSGLAQREVPNHFFFMGHNRALHWLILGPKVFLQRLVLVSVLPAENMYGTLTLVSLPLWVLCTLLLVGYDLAPAFV